MMRIRVIRLRAAAVAAVLLGVTGCSNPAGPGSQPTLAGTWFGSALLPNGYSATMELQQSGSSITGTMTVAGSYVRQTLSGTYFTSSRTFDWSVHKGCEVWSGALTLETSGSRLSGTILRDGRGCVPQVSDVNGSLSLVKQ